MNIKTMNLQQELEDRLQRCLTETPEELKETLTEGILIIGIVLCEIAGSVREI